jgi:hypothetical protein
LEEIIPVNKIEENMRIGLVILILTFCATGLNAQTFLKHLQTAGPNGAVVTVHQNAKIDELINNTPKSVVPASKSKSEKDIKKSSERNNVVTLPSNKSLTPPTEKTRQTETEYSHSSGNPVMKDDIANEKNSEENDEDIEIATVDMRKKVMRNSYKVTGYRVQVFAGGNSRQDRQKAERIGNDVKMNFPDEPVYTHFYPPRWICRMGNYRTYNEANEMLRQIKRLGYNQACIVKGKISVQY